MEKAKLTKYKEMLETVEKRIETSLYNEKNIEKKYADKPNERHAQILSSRYQNGFYVYFLRKLLI